MIEMLIQWLHGKVLLFSHQTVAIVQLKYGYYLYIPFHKQNDINTSSKSCISSSSDIIFYKMCHFVHNEIRNLVITIHFVSSIYNLNFDDLVLPLLCHEFIHLLQLLCYRLSSVGVSVFSSIKIISNKRVNQKCEKLVKLIYDLFKLIYFSLSINILTWKTI